MRDRGIKEASYHFIVAASMIPVAFVYISLNSFMNFSAVDGEKTQHTGEY